MALWLCTVILCNINFFAVSSVDWITVLVCIANVDRLTTDYYSH